MFETPTQSVPAGFVVVFFGVMGWIYSAMAGYAAWLVYHRVYIEHHPVEYSLSSLLMKSGAGFFVGLLLIAYGLRMAWRVSPYDTRDPKEPMIKF